MKRTILAGIAAWAIGLYYAVAVFVDGDTSRVIGLLFAAPLAAWFTISAIRLYRDGNAAVTGEPGDDEPPADGDDRDWRHDR